MTLTLKEVHERKLYPRVAEIFAYPNRDVVRSTPAQFDKLRRGYSDFKCAGIAEFISFIQFNEAAMKSAMSYNFSLVPHFTASNEGENEFEVKAILLQQDLLIGSRFGDETAVDWLMEILGRIDEFVNDEMLFLNGIFSNAVLAVANPSCVMKGSDLIELAHGRELKRNFPPESCQ